MVILLNNQKNIKLKDLIMIKNFKTYHMNGL